jgi:hypothetical protein
MTFCAKPNSATIASDSLGPTPGIVRNNCTRASALRHSSATAHEETPHKPFSNTLQKLVRRVDALKNENTESRRVEALTEIICGADEEAAAALLVLMGAIENLRHPAALINTVKHLAFTHCGELNVYGIVDAQIATLESELFS